MTKDTFRRALRAVPQGQRAVPERWQADLIERLLRRLPLCPDLREIELESWAWTLWLYGSFEDPPSSALRAAEELERMASKLRRMGDVALSVWTTQMPDVDLLASIDAAARICRDTVRQGSRGKTVERELARCAAEAYEHLIGTSPPTTDPGGSDHPYLRFVRNLFDLAGFDAPDYHAREAARDIKKGRECA